MFYHISHLRFRDSILQNGLKHQMGSGIYVTRSSNTMVARSIFEEYCLVGLVNDDHIETGYQAISIKIDPKKHGITIREIMADHAMNSPTLITQNVIARNAIDVTEQDIGILAPWRPIQGIDRDDIEAENRLHPKSLEFVDENGVLRPYNFDDQTTPGGIITNRWLS